jgi:hypothetical protein
MNSAARAGCQNDERRRERTSRQPRPMEATGSPFMFMIKAVPWHDMGQQLGPTGVSAGNGRVVVRPVVGEAASFGPRRRRSSTSTAL